MPRIILYDQAGDLEREKELTAFANNQLFILKDLMKFQNLAQDQRRVELVDGSVIVVKSVYNNDIIQVYSPKAVEEEIAVALGPCDTRGIIFVSVTLSNVIQFHRYIMATDTLTLLSTLDLNTELGNLSNRVIHIVAAHEDLNAIVLKVFVTDWRGATVLNTVYDNYFPVKLPISFYGMEQAELGMYGIAVAQYPAQLSLSRSGFLWYHTNYITSVVGGNYRRPLNQFSLVNPSVQYAIPVVESATTVYYWRVPVVTTYKDTLIRVVYKERFDRNTGMFIEVFEAYIATYSNLDWNGAAPTYQHDFSMTVDANNHPSLFYTTQVLAYDDKIYLFYGQKLVDQPLGPTVLEVEVFDLFLNVVIARKAITGVETARVGCVTVVTVNKVNYLCFKSSGSFVYFIDPETVNVVKAFDFGVVGVTTTWNPVGQAHLSIGSNVPNFIAVNEPITNNLLDIINAYRFTLPGYHEYYADYNYTMKINFLGYSCALESCATAHAKWLTANSLLQHADINANTVLQRVVEYGFRAAVAYENLALIDTTVFITDADQEAEVLRLWQESAIYKSNIEHRDINTMGYYAKCYPLAVHAISVSDSNAFLPTSGLTLIGSTITLTEAQYGKIKLFVYNAAKG
ncbi:MAG: hypothetical protein M0R68_03955 [Bacteroidetes bacterium]|nr:hypothetical protein [Bacteroidota bacterium]